MKFEQLKKTLFLNKKEIILNKKVTVQEKELILLSFIEGEESNKLYALYKGNKEIKEEYFLPDTFQYEDINDSISEENYDENDYEYKENTNEEELINNIESSKEDINIFFKEMIVQGKKITFQSACSNSLEYTDTEEMIIIQHYINLGIISEEWDEVHIENMILAKFEQSEEEDFPIIEDERTISITLIADEQSREVLINHTFSVNIGKYDKDTKIYYINEENKEEFFYLDEIDRYDIWKDIYENLDKNIQHLCEGERKEFKEEYIRCSEEECPRDMDLLTIKYETEDNTQLSFFTKNYLEDDVYDYSSSSTIMLMSFDVEKGINGYEKYTENLKPIEKDDNSSIEIVLFSKHVNIPSEILTFEI